MDVAGSWNGRPFGLQPISVAHIFAPSAGRSHHLWLRDTESIVVVPEQWHASPAASRFATQGIRSLILGDVPAGIGSLAISKLPKSTPPRKEIRTVWNHRRVSQIKGLNRLILPSDESMAPRMDANASKVRTSSWNCSSDCNACVQFRGH